MDASKDPKERLLTAKHELAHAMGAYAIRACQIDVRVFPRVRRMRTCIGTAHALGVCSYRCPTVGVWVSEVFVTSAPYATSLYPPSDGDEREFLYAAQRFAKVTGLKTKFFKSFVLDPLREYMESDPVIAIINRLAQPLANAGRLRAKTWQDFERFFPKDISYPFLRAMTRNLQEITREHPFVK